jgi:hypothetical protein
MTSVWVKIMRAIKLADGLRQINGIIVDDSDLFTNMIYFNLAESLQ